MFGLGWLRIGEYSWFLRIGSWLFGERSIELSGLSGGISRVWMLLFWF